MNEEILEFVNNRPKVVAAYGYGSGVFKQSGYTSKDKRQIDLILVVDDLRKWHLENMKMNKKDYSFIGKLFFKHGSIKKLKGKTGITYVSNIHENGQIFKYGTIEVKDLEKYLSTWKSFYLPGRFQKTIYPIVETEELKKKIEKNREQALLLSSFLQNNNEVTKKDLLVTLCGLSYLGDTRMKIAENPRKVLNIVEGSFDTFDRLYKFDRTYLKHCDNKLIIDKEKVRDSLTDLPSELVEYITPYLNEDDEIIKAKILEYFSNINKTESSTQTIKGIKTNGVVRSVNYAAQKVGKRFKH